ncbi:MAG: 4-hydroxy-tetrahydrodipicolinate synthase [Chloroflexota bacterium]|nr:4-hydroxy-tetrahydrodipicolinate synthase [Chloroflexota bacterium]
MPGFGSILTAMVTPFDEQKRLDEDATVAMMRHLVANGSDGVVLSGTTGEASTLPDDEKIRLFELGMETLGGDATIVAGTGSNDTAHSVHLTEVAAKLGVDAVLVVTPYYNRPPRAGLIGHVRSIAQVGVPVILYNIPSRTVVNLPPDLIAEMAEIPGVVAVKEANPDQVDEVLGIPGLVVYAGNDDLLLPVALGGGAGVISVASHLVGPQMRAVREAARSGDGATATRLDAALHDLYDGLFVTTSPILIKAALAMLGLIPCGHLRLPLVEATAQEREELTGLLEAQGILVNAS